MLCELARRAGARQMHHYIERISLGIAYENEIQMSVCVILQRNAEKTKRVGGFLWL